MQREPVVWREHIILRSSLSFIFGSVTPCEEHLHVITKANAVMGWRIMQWPRAFISFAAVRLPWIWILDLQTHSQNMCVSGTQCLYISGGLNIEQQQCLDGSWWIEAHAVGPMHTSILLPSNRFHNPFCQHWSRDLLMLTVILSIWLFSTPSIVGTLW